MNIVLIAAVSRNGVIGKDGAIPWDLKEELKFFQKQTTGSAIIMGRATHESIGRPLPNRLNILMTRSPKKRDDGVIEVSTKEKACEAARAFSDEIYIIGGENIYKEFMPLAQAMLITEVELDIQSGSTFFPEWDNAEWKEVSRVLSEEGDIKFSFVKYYRY
jgi:dihydrofolate reductase|tara:strand:+ start:96 stop:578 length:483 start_codon:yes stop_codon:yes gene_type:complete